MAEEVTYSLRNCKFDIVFFVAVGIGRFSLIYKPLIS